MGEKRRITHRKRTPLYVFENAAEAVSECLSERAATREFGLVQATFWPYLEKLSVICGARKRY